MKFFTACLCVLDKSLDRRWFKRQLGLRWFFTKRLDFIFNSVYTFQSQPSTAVKLPNLAGNLIVNRVTIKLMAFLVDISILTAV
jgi:hypothetical protein